MAEDPDRILSLSASRSITNFAFDHVDASHTISERLEPPKGNYLKGWPLHTITLALCLSIFLSGLEVSIIATSLVAITDDLQGFRQSSWIITAYMITYTGFMIIWAKLSDIFGRKTSIVASLCIFTIFSAACGAAQTVTEVIVLRAFQGIGGGGISSLVTVIFIDLVPPAKFPNYTSMVSGIISIALLLGPLFGGLINDNTTWRWVFLMNVPAGITAIIILVIAMPRHFPHHGLPQATYDPMTWLQTFSKAQFRRVDFLGTGLLLSATILLVAPLEEADVTYAWDSAFVIVLLIVSGISWIGFLFWSRKVTRGSGAREPVFPWRFMQSRVRIGLLLGMFLAGAPFTAAVIQIPLKFQVVDSLSPLGAGIRLLPFAFATALGAVVAAAVVGKFKIPPIYVFIVGSAVQAVGFGLLSTLPASPTIRAAQYGFEILAGFAIGCDQACLVVMAPFAVESRDKSVAMSAMIQFRTMGGAIGLAAVTTAMNSYVKTNLADFLSPNQVGSLLQSTEAFAALPPALAETAKIVFANGYNLQFRIMIGFSAAQVPVALLLWQREQIVV